MLTSATYTVITDRVRSTREGNVYTWECLSVHTGEGEGTTIKCDGWLLQSSVTRGTPILLPDRGVHPSRQGVPPSFLMGGPLSFLIRGTPILPNGGLPHPSWLGGGPLAGTGWGHHHQWMGLDGATLQLGLNGVTPPGTGWGTPTPTWDWMGYTPTWNWMGYPSLSGTGWGTSPAGTR